MDRAGFGLIFGSRRGEWGGPVDQGFHPSLRKTARTLGETRAGSSLISRLISRAVWAATMAIFLWPNATNAVQRSM